MKRILLALLPFAVFADTCHLEQTGGGDWRIVCEGSGLEYNYIDVTNEVYVYQNCEGLKSSLLSSIDSLKSDIVSASSSADNIRNKIDVDLVPSLHNSSFSSSDDRQIALNYAQQASGEAYSLYYKLESAKDILYLSTNSLEAQVQSINCASCPTNGASGGGSGGSCCDVDFTDIINRMIIAEQQRAAISDQIARISNYLGVVTNQLAYNNFLLEHGFNNTTNLLYYGLYATEDDIYPYDFIWAYDYRGRWSTDQMLFPYNEPYSLASLALNFGYNTSLGLASLNNFNHSFFQPSFINLTNTIGSISEGVSFITNELASFHSDTTNFFSFFRGEIGVQGVLEDWTNEEADGTYHDFLTNHYINVVRGGSLSGNSSSKTNWFSRIETLLASLVFLDNSNTNAYDSASQAVSNSINRVTDDFNSTLDGVSSAPSTQMELVSDIEKSMYESLQSFSQAFSSASLPSSVRLIYVYKSSGSRSLSLSSDTVDVNVPVEGKLMDFIEIIRSATTLCWVFFGLWFMFKFSVWTVKKIYMLIRYIIDFFNMVAGGK